MTATRIDEPPTYVFGRRDRGSLLVGFRAGQLILIGIGMSAILLGFLVGGGPGGVVGAVICGVAAFTAVFPVQGRPIVDWARPVANYAFGRITGRTRYLGGPWGLRRNRYLKRLELPSLGQSLRLREVTTPLGPVAVLQLRDRWTVVVQVASPTYVLADRASQERRVAAWGSLLAQCGQEGSRIAGIQWLERTVPDSGQDLQTWWGARGHPSSPFAEHYQALIAEAGPTATRHETFIAVSIDAHRLRRQIKRTGGGTEGATSVLLAEMGWVRQALTRVDLEVTGLVGVGDLTRLIRTQYDPASTDGIDRRPGQRTAHLPPVAAGPMATETSWSHYRTDSGIHAVYWIAEWPSMPVEAAWCYPLLALGGIRRTVTVCQEPIPPSRSLREVRSARVTKRADETQRRRLGQVETAQDDEEYTALERRGRELVHGHTEYKFTGWVSVTADSPEALEAACAQVEQAAVRSAIEVRRVHGEVDQAFTVAALPLNQGVRS